MSVKIKDIADNSPDDIYTFLAKHIALAEAEYTTSLDLTYGVPKTVLQRLERKCQLHKYREQCLDAMIETIKEYGKNE